MNTCGTCKFKGKPFQIWDYLKEPYKMVDSRFFLCGKAEHAGCASTIAEEGNVSIGTKCFVADGSGYFAALCVSEDFGCNEWEPIK